MFKKNIFIIFPVLGFLLLTGCGGVPEEGIYIGTIGKKNEVVLTVNRDESIKLEGYWREPLLGRHEQGSLKGENMDAMVFEGPAIKKFKLRILYEEDQNGLIIRAIQSRTYGPGARYLSTEEEGVFSPPPRLSRISTQ